MFTELSAVKLQQQSKLQLNKKRKITDMVVVSKHKLMMSVLEQRTIILVDSGSGQVLSEITLHNKPRSLVMMGVQLAAATLADCKVQLVEVNGATLKAKTNITVGVDVYGIAAHQHNLIVSYDPPGVKIISMNGTVIHNLDNTTAGKEVFKKPRSIATSFDDSIFVTDWGTHQITRLDVSLTILQTFAGSLMLGPHGIIALNNDCILVCSRDNNSILLIWPSTNSMTVVLERQHGIKSPKSLCFCKEQKKLYVAPYADEVPVFQLSE